MSEYVYPGYIKTDDIVKYCEKMARDYELINPSYSDACSDIGNKCLDLSNRDITEIKHGEWKTDREEIVVRYGDEYEVHIPYCSECGWKRSNVYEYLGPGKVKWNFCPNCGADMRGETE